MTFLTDLPAHRLALAYSIISDADLNSEEDLLLRTASHDFEEGIAWGLRLTLAAHRGVAIEDLEGVIR